MRRSDRRRLLMVLLAATGVLVFAAANAHLVYVALVSQPDCVRHLKEKGTRPGEFRAAQPAC